MGRKGSLDISKLVLIVIFTFFLSIFIFKTFRSLIPSVNKDLVTIYLSTIAWAEGKNPYDHDLLRKIWISRNGNQDIIPDIDGRPSVYPTMTFLLLLPLSFLTWPQAVFAMTIVNVIVFLLILVIFFSLGKLKLYDTSGILLLIAAISLGPFRDNINQGNPALLSFVFLVFSFLVYLKGHKILSGLLLAVSTSFKPQVGVALLLYYFFMRNYKEIIYTTIFLIIIFIASVHFDINYFDYYKYYISNLKEAFYGGVNDPRTKIYLSMSIISLNKIYPYLPQNMIIPLKGILTLLLIANLIKYKAETQRDKELALCYVITFSLLIIYHRYADGVLLFFILYYAIALYNISKNRIHLYIYILTLLPFMLSLHQQFENISGKFNSLWPTFGKNIQTFISIHQPIFLLILFSLLSYLIYKRTNQLKPLELISKPV